jgi:hypothetical protein
LLARLRAQLEALRGQARRLHGALSEDRRPPAVDDSVRAPSQAAAPPGKVRDRAEPFTSRTVAVELSPMNLKSLVAKRLLSVEDLADGERVGAAVRWIVDRWTLEFLRSLATEGLTADITERRSGHDRRRTSPRPTCLLSYVEGSDLDRRSGRDRRRGLDRRRTGLLGTVSDQSAARDASGPDAGAGKLIDLAGYREQRPRRRSPRATADLLGMGHPAESVDRIQREGEPGTAKDP